MSEMETIKVHCNACGHETKHLLLKSRITEGGEVLEDYGPISWRDTYEMLECRGCESVVMRHSHYFEPSDKTTVNHYPPRVSRPSPRWKFDLPEVLTSRVGWVKRSEPNIITICNR